MIYIYMISYMCPSGDMKEREELHQCLQRLQRQGRLLAVSNNKAEYD